MENSIRSSEISYGRVAKLLHWGIALLVVGLFVSGHFAGDTKDNAEKLFFLRIHVPIGISILLLTLIRIFWWWRIDSRPKPAIGVTKLQASAAKIVHVLLYIIPLGMVASGMGMMILTGAGEELFFKANGILPDFHKVLPRMAHGTGAKILIGVIVLHVLAALFHHFALKDDTLSRMWRGKR